MKRMFARCLALALGATAAVPIGVAQADTSPFVTTVMTDAARGGDTFTGGCGFAVVNDPSPNGLVGGGPEVWSGVIYIADAAKDGGPIATSCEIRINGVALPWGVSASGSGATSNESQIRFTAADTDSVSLCTHVTTNASTEVACDPATDLQVPPQALIDGVYLAPGGGCTLDLVGKIWVRPYPTNPATTVTYVAATAGDVVIWVFCVV